MQMYIQACTCRHRDKHMLACICKKHVCACPHMCTCNTHSLRCLVALAFDEGLQASLLPCTIPRVHQVLTGQLSVSARGRGDDIPGRVLYIHLISRSPPGTFWMLSLRRSKVHSKWRVGGLCFFLLYEGIVETNKVSRAPERKTT